MLNQQSRYPFPDPSRGINLQTPEKYYRAPLTQPQREGEIARSLKGLDSRTARIRRWASCGFSVRATSSILVGQKLATSEQPDRRGTQGEQRGNDVE